MSTCSIDGCDRPSKARGMCNTHYERWRRHGDPLIVLSVTHGMSKTPLFRIWVQMIRRCTKPEIKQYQDYGGRGITVCDRWRDFANFYADMGDRPEGLTLDRIDNDGNYEPGNYRWATRSEQQRNRRVPVFDTCQIDGCERPHGARGMCSMHYLRWKRHGNPGNPEPLRRRAREAVAS